MEELKQNYRYLVYSGTYMRDLIEIKVLEISEKAYKLKFGVSSIGWKSKEIFNEKYTIFEEIGEEILKYTYPPLTPTQR